MAGDDSQDAAPAVCTFIKKTKGSRAVRKKKESSSSEGEGEGQVVVKERKKASGLVAGSNSTRKRRKTDGNGGVSEDDTDDLLVLAKADGRVVCLSLLVASALSLFVASARHTKADGICKSGTRTSLQQQGLHLSAVWRTR